MKITVTKHDNTLHARLHGSMDISSALQDKETLLSLLESCQRIDVDLGLEELDTAGIQILLLWRREAANSGVVWTLGKISEPVAEALSVYHLDLGAPFVPALREETDDGR